MLLASRPKPPARKNWPSDDDAKPLPNIDASGSRCLLVDQTPERQGIGLVPDMPVRGPGQLAEAGDAARLGHSRQAEIEPIGEEARHEDPRIGGSFTRPQMGEAV